MRLARTLAAALAAALLVAAVRAGAAATPDVAGSALPSVVSINLCADQLLLELAEPAQILSVSWLAADASASHHVARAAGLPINDGTAEAVLALMPDLVIVGEYSDRYTVRLLEARGLKLRTLPVADSIAGVLDNLVLVGEWTGRPAEVRAKVAALEARLAAVDRDVAAAARGGSGAPAAAVYDPNGYTVGPASLRGEMLARAGFRNVAEEAGIDGYGSLSLEALLHRAPDVLIDSPYSPGTWSRAQALALHPALRARGLDPAVIALASADTICGGPWTVTLIERLAAERRAIARRTR